MPLRAAMPSTVTKPTSDPSDSTPPVRNTLATPPINANGIVSATSATSRAEPKSTCSTSRMPSSDTAPSARSRRCDSARAAYSPEHLRVIAGRRSGRVRSAASMSRATAPRSRPAHVAGDVDAPRSALARDLVRRRRHDDVGHRLQRRIAAVRQLDRQTPQREEIPTLRRRAPHHHVEDLLLVEHLPDLRARAASSRPCRAPLPG